MNSTSMSRCSTHGLTTGSDGACVLCRSGKTTWARARREERARSTGVFWSPIVAATGIGFAFLLSLGSGVRLYSTALASADAVPASAPGATPRPGAPRSNGTNGTATSVTSNHASVQIELYGASWCPACRAAKRWLDDHHIAYTEYDIDRDRAAGQRLRRLSPRGSIPVLVVEGGQPMIGFNAPQLEAAIARAETTKAH